MSEPAEQQGGGAGIAGEAFVDRGPCPLCGDERFETVHDFAKVPVRRCVSCGFVHSARVMTAEGARRYYTGEFGSARHRDGQILNAAINERVLARLVDLGRVRTFLDVGAGYGFLLARMRDRRGISGVGVELSAGEAAHGVERLGVDIRRGTLDEAGLAHGSFDLVTAFEVIEHVQDPVPFVRSLARHCRPGGHVVIGTDNFESPTVRRLGAEFRKWIPHSHVSHFGPATLRRCVEAAGGLAVTGGGSFTPWENVLQRVLMRRAPRPAAEAFDLDAFVRTEMARGYRMFGVRRRISAAWFGLRWRRTMNGAMMYLSARREG